MSTGGKIFVALAVLVIVAAIGEFGEAPPPAPTRAAAVGAEIHPDVEITKFGWRKGGFGTVVIATFWIANHEAFAVKDIDVACELTARSGTILGVVADTIYDTIPAHGKRVFRDLNMGSGVVLDLDQAARASCKLGAMSRGSSDRPRRPQQRKSPAEGGLSRASYPPGGRIVHQIRRAAMFSVNASQTNTDAAFIRMMRSRKAGTPRRSSAVIAASRL